MANIREIIGLFKITNHPTTYVSKPGAIVVNESTGLAYIHDGVTPGDIRHISAVCSGHPGLAGSAYDIGAFEFSFSHGSLSTMGMGQ